jgi:hypothetical protein
VKLKINVPGLGERIVDMTNISALTLAEASGKAVATVIIEPIQAQQTAP